MARLLGDLPDTFDVVITFPNGSSERITKVSRVHVEGNTLIVDYHFDHKADGSYMVKHLGFYSLYNVRSWKPED